MNNIEFFEPKVIERYFQDLSLLKTLEHPICILGVPGLTRLGEKCAEYLVKELQAEKFMKYYYSDFEPISLVEKQDHIAELMHMEIYIAKKTKSRSDIIIITGNGMPKSPTGIHFLSEKIAEFVQSVESQLLLSIAAFPISYSTHTPRTYLAHTSEELLKIFKIDEKSHQNKDLRLQLLEKGVVIGLNGLAVAYAESLYDVMGGILLPETVTYMETDLIAIQAVLKVLNTSLNLQLSFSFLLADIKEQVEKKAYESPSAEDSMKKARKRIKN